MSASRSQGRRSAVSEDDGSRALAQLGYSLLILLAAPAFTLDHFDKDGRGGFIQFSPLEVAAITMVDNVPPLVPAAQSLLLPAAYLKRVSKTLMYCYEKRAELCDWSPLFNIHDMLKEADVQELIPTFKGAFKGNAWTLLTVGSLVSVLSALTGLIRPVRLGVLGLLMMLLAVYVTTDANFIPTLIMMSFLGGYVTLYFPASGKRQTQKAGKKSAAAGPSGASGSGSTKKAASAGKGSGSANKATPAKAGNVAKATPSSDKKKLYNI